MPTFGPLEESERVRRDSAFCMPRGKRDAAQVVKRSGAIRPLFVYKSLMHRDAMSAPKRAMRGKSQAIP